MRECGIKSDPQETADLLADDLLVTILPQPHARSLSLLSANAFRSAHDRDAAVHKALIVSPGSDNFPSTTLQPGDRSGDGSLRMH